MSFFSSLYIWFGFQFGENLLLYPNLVKEAKRIAIHLFEGNEKLKTRWIDGNITCWATNSERRWVRAAIEDELMGIEDELMGIEDELMGIKDELMGIEDELMGISPVEQQILRGDGWEPQLKMRNFPPSHNSQTKPPSKGGDTQNFLFPISEKMKT